MPWRTLGIWKREKVGGRRNVLERVNQSNHKRLGNMQKMRMRDPLEEYTERKAREPSGKEEISGELVE